MELSEMRVGCPYCGEHITILVDDSEPEQHYIEDCQVCCRPIELRVRVAFDGTVSVEAFHENDIA